MDAGHHGQMIREGNFLHAKLLKRAVDFMNEHVVQVRLLFDHNLSSLLSRRCSKNTSGHRSRNRTPETQREHVILDLRQNLVEIAKEDSWQLSVMDELGVSLDATHHLSHLGTFCGTCRNVEGQVSHLPLELPHDYRSRILVLSLDLEFLRP